MRSADQGWKTDGQSMTGPGPVGHGGQVGRDVLEGKRLPGWRQGHVVDEETEVVAELLGVPLSGNHDQQEVAQLLGQPGEGEGPPPGRHRPDPVHWG